MKYIAITLLCLISLLPITAYSFSGNGGPGGGGAGSGITATANITTNGVLYGTGTGSAASTAPLGTGTVLYGQGAGSPPIASTITFANAATQGDLHVATGANTIGELPDVALGSVLGSGGVGAVPTYVNEPYSPYQFQLPGSANTGFLMGVYLVPKTQTIANGTCVFFTLSGCGAGGATVKVWDCGTSLPGNAAACTAGTTLVTWASGVAVNAAITGTVNSATITGAHYIGLTTPTLNSCTTILGQCNILAQ